MVVGRRLTVVGRRLTVVGHRLTVVGHRLTVVGRRLTVVGRRLTVVGRRLTVVGRRLTVVGRRLTVVGRRLTVVGRRLTVVGRRLTVVGRRLTVVGHRLTVVGHRLTVVGRRLTVVGRRLTVVGRRLTVVGSIAGAEGGALRVGSTLSSLSPGSQSQSSRERFSTLRLHFIRAAAGVDPPNERPVKSKEDPANVCKVDGTFETIRCPTPGSDPLVPGGGIEIQQEDQVGHRSKRFVGRDDFFRVNARAPW
jgi:hypothetical protein